MIHDGHSDCDDAHVVPNDGVNNNECTMSAEIITILLLLLHMIILIIYCK